MESQIAILSCSEKKLKFFPFPFPFSFFQFDLQKGFDNICHDIHSLLNYICTIFVNAHIDQGLNPRLYRSTPRF
jgi:hypothetical protein